MRARLVIRRLRVRPPTSSRQHTFLETDDEILHACVRVFRLSVRFVCFTGQLIGTKCVRVRVSVCVCVCACLCVSAYGFIEPLCIELYSI